MNTLVTQATEQIKQRPLVVTLIVFVVGVLLGWIVLGWGLFPVEYINGDIFQLRDDLKQDYVRMVASAYVLDGESGVQRAADRIARLGPDAPNVVEATLQTSAGDEAIRIQQLQFVLTQVGALGQPGAAPAPSLMDQLRLPLLLCGLVIVVGVIGGFLYMRMGGLPGRGRATKPKPAFTRASVPVAETVEGVAEPAVATPTGEPPVARFMTTYTLGDDNYDDSFSVDGPEGSFLGECGMGISETIGVGDPKKVQAFEVWLFDKNDIRTVTKVVMSEHGFRDEGLKSRLAAKGEPVQAAPGDTVSLETATLIVTARVVDMAYGGGALPQNSFFERMTIELAAYKKAAAA